MPLGMEVGLGPGDFVLDGDPAPHGSKRDNSPPIFGLCVLWPNGWMHQDTTWYGGSLRPGDIVLDEDPAHPYKGTPLNFRPMSIVAKQLDGSKCNLVRRQASAQATLCYMGTKLPRRGTAPNFRPMSIVAKRSPISATAELLFIRECSDTFKVWWDIL